MNLTNKLIKIFLLGEKKKRKWKLRSNRHTCFMIAFPDESKQKLNKRLVLEILISDRHPTSFVSVLIETSRNARCNKAFSFYLWIGPGLRLFPSNNNVPTVSRLFIKTNYSVDRVFPLFDKGSRVTPRNGNETGIKSGEQRRLSRERENGNKVSLRGTSKGQLDF